MEVNKTGFDESAYRHASYQYIDDVKFGLCVPKECNSSDKMRFLDKAFSTFMQLANVLPEANYPNYSFPALSEHDLWNHPSIMAIVSSTILMLIVAISLIGYMVGKSPVGDKQRLSKLVVAVDEDNPNRISVESRKNRCALFFYSFSFSRNFLEIFTKSPKTIRDSKFAVFDGLRVHMTGWIILGHCYLLGDYFGDSSELLRYQALQNPFTQIIISADMAISFMYFMSGFIGMYALIKKFQQSNENAETARKEYETNDIAIKSMNVPRLSKKALGL